MTDISLWQFSAETVLFKATNKNDNYTILLWELLNRQLTGEHADVQTLSVSRERSEAKKLVFDVKTTIRKTAWSAIRA